MDMFPLRATYSGDKWVCTSCKYTHSGLLTIELDVKEEMWVRLVKVYKSYHVCTTEVQNSATWCMETEILRYILNHIIWRGENVNRNNISSDSDTVVFFYAPIATEFEALTWSYYKGLNAGRERHRAYLDIIVKGFCSKSNCRRRIRSRWIDHAVMKEVCYWTQSSTHITYFSVR